MLFYIWGFVTKTGRLSWGLGCKVHKDLRMISHSMKHWWSCPLKLNRGLPLTWGKKVAGKQGSQDLSNVKVPLTKKREFLAWMEEITYAKNQQGITPGGGDYCLCSYGFSSAKNATADDRCCLMSPEALRPLPCWIKSFLGGLRCDTMMDGMDPGLGSLRLKARFIVISNQPSAQEMIHLKL